MARIQFDLQTREFNKLVKLGNDYIGVLNKTQTLWAGIGNKIVQAHKNTTWWSKSVDLLKRDWMDLGKVIGRITTSLLNWKTYFGLLKGAFSIGKGLLGGGGLFGLEGLASSASSSRREALGIGSDYGKMNSFLMNFQRLVDAQQLLSRVSSSKYDITSEERLGMINMGLGSNSEIAKDPVDQSRDVIKKLPEILKGVPESLWLTIAHNRKIPLSDESIIRTMKEDPKTRKQIDDMYEKHEKDMSLSKEEQSSWTLLNTQLGIAAKSVETLFQRKLMKLAEGTADLSEVLTEKFKKAIDSPAFTKIVNMLGDGLENLAKWLNQPDIGKQIDEFITKVSSFIVNVGRIVKSFDHLVSSFFGDSASTPNNMVGDMASGMGPGSGGRGPGSAGEPGSQTLTEGGTIGKWWTQENMKYMAHRLETEGGATKYGAAGLIARMAGIEARGGPSSFNLKRGGHYNIGQWDPDRGGLQMRGASFQDAVSHIIDELKHPEKWNGAKAVQTITHALTPEQGALGGSEYERGEGYDKYSGRDNLYAGTPVKGVYNRLYGNPADAVTSQHEYKSIRKKIKRKDPNDNTDRMSPEELQHWYEDHPNSGKQSRLNVGHEGMWQGRTQLSLNIYSKVGSNPIIDASRLGMGPA